MSNRVLYVIVISFAVGIFIRSYFVVPTVVLLSVFVAGCALFLFSILLRNTGKGILVALCIMAVVIGSVRYEISERRQSEIPNMEVGNKVVLTGIIIDDPEDRESTQKFTIRNSKTHIRVSTDRYPEFSYGDEVEVRGTLEKPENFTTDQGKEFDYVSYLLKDDISYLVSFAKVRELSTGHGSIVQAKLYDFRRNILEHYEHLIREPESSLVSGVVLGERSGISSTLRNEFITTSTIHIIALSGFNISILASLVRDFFAFFLPRALALTFGGVTVILFVVMTGAQSTAVRAGIMALIALLARGTGRSYEASRALFMAVFCMLLWNPKLLAFDVSFQLSFLATLGLIYVTPIFEKKLHWIRFKYLRETIATTLGAQVTVLPLILYTMGTLSFIGIPINILIAPFVPIVMFLGLGLALLSFVSMAVAYPIALLTSISATILLALIHVSAQVPYASVTVSTFPIILMIGLYILIFYIVRKLGRESLAKDPN
jgi:competence protein ComEC